ncbi:MAG: hypothetical protein AAB092_08275, partial [Chloroflexota bacterium]
MSDKEAERQKRSFVRKPRRDTKAEAGSATSLGAPTDSKPPQKRAAAPESPRERIVVPRQERGRTASPVDIELREV